MAGKQDIYFQITNEIERRFPVGAWRVGDIPVWPAFRLVLEDAAYGVAPPAAPVGRAILGRLLKPVSRSLSYAATPLANLWQSRSDIGNVRLRLHSSDVLFLGNGGTADNIEGVLHDRFCEPLIASYEETGTTTFLMEHGAVRTPWSRPVYNANTIDRWARLSVRASGAATRIKALLPGHAEVLETLRNNGIHSANFSEEALRFRGALITAMSRTFGRVLGRLKPRAAFAVCYYSDIGYALMHACRAQGVLSVDIQHGGQGGQHKAYNRFATMPDEGYSVLPAIFWNWTLEETEAINVWASKLPHRWHQAVHGGHPQHAPWFDNSNSRTQAFDHRINAIKASRPGKRDILVALQDMEVHRPYWDVLAEFIETDSESRWWIRRHPSPYWNNGRSTARVLAIKRPNVILDEATNFPLPALLRHMNGAISVTSGAVVEGSWFGVKGAFLNEDARAIHPGLFSSGKAEVLKTGSEIEAFLSRSVSGGRGEHALPDISKTLASLDEYASDYRALCAARPL